MTFEEAKNREDYDFNISGPNSVTEFIHDIRTNEFMNWTEYNNEDGYVNYSTAVLELGFVDIELNINAVAEGDGYINQPYPCYFVNVKGYDDDWAPAGYTDDFGYMVEVDWWAPDWIIQLERDMFNKLMEFVAEFGLKIDEPNWTEPDHEFDVFDRVCGIER